MSLLLPVLVIYAVASSLFVGGPLLRNRWRSAARWKSLDSIGLFLPFSVWLAFEIGLDRGKSLSNLVTEPAIVALGVGVASFVRIAIGRRWPERRSRIMFLALSCGVSWLVWYATPALPE